jgi:SAM-dependent methyltransferase
VTNTESWDRIAARATSNPPIGLVRYGPEGPTEDDLRLIGDVADKRVLDLGCGAGEAAVTFARRGATVIGVDKSSGQLDRARRLAEHHEVRVEWHRGDLADLAFLRADSIDLAFSAFTLAEVPDAGRLFRQVHRVLRPGGPFVFSYEHPLALCTGPEPSKSSAARKRTAVLKSYFADDPVTVKRHGEPLLLYRHPLGDVFAALGRAGFRVEVIVEPRPPSPQSLVPAMAVWRARKEGV